MGGKAENQVTELTCGGERRSSGPGVKWAAVQSRNNGVRAEVKVGQVGGSAGKSTCCLSR